MNAFFEFHEMADLIWLKSQRNSAIDQAEIETLQNENRKEED